MSDSLINECHDKKPDDHQPHQQRKRYGNIELKVIFLGFRYQDTINHVLYDHLIFKQPAQIISTLLNFLPQILLVVFNFLYSLLDSVFIRSQLRFFGSIIRYLLFQFFQSPL